MILYQVWVLLLLFIQPSTSFIFPTYEEQESLYKDFIEPVKEVRDYDPESGGGWFGLFVPPRVENKDIVLSDAREKGDPANEGGWFGFFTSHKDESELSESTQEPNLPVISDEWMQKYTEMIEQLSNLDTILKESQLSQDLLNKYNSSFYQLKEIKSRLETSFESTIDKYNDTARSFIMDTARTINKGKQLFMSYDWFEKYSDAIDTLDEVKTAIDNSVSHEMQKITSTLSGLKNSWERFSFYNIWQEQYKRLANINLSWNNSLMENEWFKSGNESLLASWKSALPTVSSYQEMIKQYLPSLGKAEPVCAPKQFTCPDNKQTFTADACCSPLWLSIGAPLGFGNECWIDLDLMVEQCDIFSCYELVNGTIGNTDGCTYIPDILLNYEACVIHDLCYVTPGVSKEECDEVMKENINKIYCDNVNIFERKLCSIRASLAATALEWTDKYFVAAGIFREKCQLADSLITRIWKFSVNRMFRPIF